MAKYGMVHVCEFYRTVGVPGCGILSRVIMSHSQTGKNVLDYALPSGVLQVFLFHSLGAGYPLCTLGTLGAFIAKRVQQVFFQASSLAAGYTFCPLGKFFANNNPERSAPSVQIAKRRPGGEK